MKRKIFKVLSLAMIFMLIFVNTAFAAPHRIISNTLRAAFSVGEKIVTTEGELRDALLGSMNTISIGANITVNGELNIPRSLTINGNGYTLTSTSTGYGIVSDGITDITFNDFILIGSNIEGNSTYGFKIQNGSNINFNNITVNNSYKSAIDLNNVSDSTLNNITASGVTKGSGIQLTDGVNIAVSNVNLSNNAWGNISVQAKTKDYVNDGDIALILSGNNTFDSNMSSIYTETNGLGSSISTENLDLTNSKISYILQDPNESTKTWYFANKASAVAAASLSSDAYVNELSSGEFVVENGMSIQGAINAASANDVINIGNGTYEEQLAITKTLSLNGNGNGTIVKAPQTLETKFTKDGENKPVIFVESNANPTITNMVVDGAGRGNSNFRFQGIGMYNANGVIDNVEVKNIIENPFSGTQHGVGIYAYNDDNTDRTIEIKNSNIHDYQKNGMALNGVGLTAIVNNNIVTGKGETGVIAQNGIQVSYGAAAIVTNNTVTGHKYVSDDQWNGGAIGIMFYNADIVNSSVSGNTYSNNNYNFYNNANELPVTIEGTIDGQAFVEGETSNIEINPDTNGGIAPISIDLTATVKGLQEFDGTLALDFGEGTTGVAVTVGETSIENNNGVFDIGTITETDTTMNYTVTVQFTQTGTYSLDIYVDERN